MTPAPVNDVEVVEASDFMCVMADTGKSDMADTGKSDREEVEAGENADDGLHCVLADTETVSSKKKTFITFA